MMRTWHTYQFYWFAAPTGDQVLLVRVPTGDEVVLVGALRHGLGDEGVEAAVAAVDERSARLDVDAQRLLGRVFGQRRLGAVELHADLLHQQQVDVEELAASTSRDSRDESQQIASCVFVP